jgi:hypothetical protein
MDRKSSILVGGALVLLGVLLLLLSGVASLLGFNLLGFVARFWPLIVVGVGLLFVIPPFLVRGQPGLGALFIPGFPILTTGAILLLASVLNAWSVWGWLWPMEVTSVAMGFLFAAVYARVIWLVIPAIIVGLNGLTFQFCAITGLWGWWSVLWTVEPLAVGLALLVVGAGTRTSGLTLAGLILCGVAGAGLLLMLVILGGGWLLGVLGPGVLILAGLAVLAWGVLRSRLQPRSAME